MDGLELAARFSYITNSLRFCGPEEASGQFLGYIKSRKNPDDVKKSLMRFEGLCPYLSSIAEKSKKDFFDYDVVEAYWIGNRILDAFDDEGIKGIIRKLVQRGLPKSIGDELIAKMPSGFVPHHNFNVFYVGVGRTTGSVPTTLQNMDNCRISSGKVIDIMKDKLIVATTLLKKERNKLAEEETAKTAVFLPEMLPDVKKGDFVALHWGFAAVVLNNTQVNNLKKYNEGILRVVNKI